MPFECKKILKMFAARTMDPSNECKTFRVLQNSTKV